MVASGEKSYFIRNNEAEKLCRESPESVSADSFIRFFLKACSTHYTQFLYPNTLYTFHKPGLIKIRTSVRQRFTYLTARFKEKCPLSSAKTQVQ